MSIVEWVVVVFSVVYVLLAGIGNPLCWPAGIIGSAIFIVYNITLHYYQDAILQFYYVLAGFYGWYVWVYEKKGTGNGPKFISKKWVELLPLIVLGLALFPVMGYLFSKIGNAYSYVDAFTTIFSFIATWMTARKILQNWIFWIVIDAILVYQYGIKHAYLISALNLFYTGISFWGYYRWQKQMALQ